MIDLHMHTTMSDGNLKPQELIKRCKSLNLNTIAITDHDQVNNYANIKNNIHILSGTEVATEVNNTLVELLIYNFDINKAKELSYMNQPTINKEVDIVLTLQKRVTKSGYKIEPITDRKQIEEKLKQYSYGQRVIFHLLKAHSENEKLIPELKHMTPNEFFRKLCCDKESIFHIPPTRELPTIKTVVNDFKSIGGKVFLAHPYLYRNSEKIIKMSTPLIDGFECSHSDHTSKQVLSLVKHCKDNNRLISGGSDFHGTPHLTNRRLGNYPMKKEIQNHIRNWIDELN